MFFSPRSRCALSWVWISGRTSAHRHHGPRSPPASSTSAKPNRSVRAFGMGSADSRAIQVRTLAPRRELTLWVRVPMVPLIFAFRPFLGLRLFCFRIAAFWRSDRNGTSVAPFVFVIGRCLTRCTSRWRGSFFMARDSMSRTPVEAIARPAWSVLLSHRRRLGGNDGRTTTAG